MSKPICAHTPPHPPYFRPSLDGSNNVRHLGELDLLFGASMEGSSVHPNMCTWPREAWKSARRAKSIRTALHHAAVHTGAEIGVRANRIRTLSGKPARPDPEPCGPTVSSSAPTEAVPAAHAHESGRIGVIAFVHFHARRNYMLVPLLPKPHE